MCFKKGAANGHPKVERMTIITIFLHKQVGGRPAAILNLCKVPVVLFVPSFGDIGKLQKNFETLTRKRRTLGEPFHLAQTWAN